MIKVSWCILDGELVGFIVYSLFIFDQLFFGVKVNIFVVSDIVYCWVFWGQGVEFLRFFFRVVFIWDYIQMCVFIFLLVYLMLSFYYVFVRFYAGVGDLKINKLSFVFLGQWCLMKEICRVDKYVYIIKDQRLRLLGIVLVKEGNNGR